MSSILDSCGPCGNVLCSQHGCQHQWGRELPHPFNPGPPAYIINTQPHGCICPPTSEQTCKGPFCPRQPHRHASAFVNQIDVDRKTTT